MAITTSKQLMDHILKTIDDIDNDSASIDKANAIFRGAVAAISVQRVQLKYAAMKGVVPQSDFLEDKE